MDILSQQQFRMNGKPFDIPVEGSLGILALGAVGIKAWREKRKAAGYKIPHTNIIHEDKEPTDEEPSKEKK